MQKLIFLFAFPILLLLSGCETPAKPPHIVINSIRLHKIPLKESGITSYIILFTSRNWTNNASLRRGEDVKKSLRLLSEVRQKRRK